MAGTRMPMPPVVLPMVEPDTGLITQHWFNFLFFLYKKLGGSNTSLQETVVVTSGAGAPGLALATNPNVPIGTLNGAGDVPGGAEVVLSPGTSPFTYTAGASGTLIASFGLCSIRRGASGTFRTCGQGTGAAMPLRKNDAGRVVWPGNVQLGRVGIGGVGEIPAVVSPPPVIVFFPN